MDIRKIKRLCIYVIYDGENIIDDYIGYMLQGLRQICDSLAVVCNGEQVQRGLVNIQKNAGQVFHRKNIGFDAGAYKDALSEYVGWDEVEYYDELILMNDSFYGPFYPLQRIFDVMKSVEADFWGLTRSKAGIAVDGMKYQEHIQSYFLVFRKQVIQSKDFRNFWEQLTYPATMEETIQNFELGINEYLKQKGFRDAAVTDLYKNILSIEENKNPYLEYPLELIRDCKIPMLKYKALSFGSHGYIDAIKVLRFLEENNLYNTACIKDHIWRKSKFEKNMINLEALEKFYESHKRIFIYGYGTYGKNLDFYFKCRGWDAEGFLVTKEQEPTERVATFEGAEIRQEDGIVIAVGKEDVCREILKHLEGKCAKEQLLFPNL